jgi:osmotically-inducible protein OsmY
MNKLLLTIVSLYLLSACSSILDASKDEPIDSNDASRSIGRMLDDESIETKALVNARKADAALRDANLVIVSFNGIVLLAGQVPDSHLRQVAEQTVTNVRYVRKVHNELTVGPPNELAARSNDSWITTRIKSRMLFSSVVDPARVKVVTEDKVVYLLGLVDQKTGDAAVDMARNTNGVAKVVRIFEYID